MAHHFTGNSLAHSATAAASGARFDTCSRFVLIAMLLAALALFAGTPARAQMPALAVMVKYAGSLPVK